MRVVRPVVRSFKWPHLDEAASLGARGRARRRVAGAAQGAPGLRAATEGGRERPRATGRSSTWGAPTTVSRVDGPFEGMAYIAVPHDCYAIVRDRIVRDSIHPEATRRLDLDCLECGACCKDNQRHPRRRRRRALREGRAAAISRSRRTPGDRTARSSSCSARTSAASTWPTTTSAASTPSARTRAARSPWAASAACRRARRRWGSWTGPRTDSGHARDFHLVERRVVDGAACRRSSMVRTSAKRAL